MFVNASPTEKVARVRPSVNFSEIASKCSSWRIRFARICFFVSFCLLASQPVGWGWTRRKVWTGARKPGERIRGGEGRKERRASKHTRPGVGLTCSL